MPSTGRKKRPDCSNGAASKVTKEHSRIRSSGRPGQGAKERGPGRRKIATFVSGHAVNHLTSGKEPTKSVATLALEAAVLRDIHKPQQTEESDAHYSARRANEALGVGIALRSAFKVMRAALLDGRKLSLPNIGTIEIYQMRPRTYRHPKTGDVLKSAGRRALRLTTSPTMRRDLLDEANFMNWVSS